MITYARKITVNGETVVVERVLEDHYETVETKTPTLVTVTKEINDPRIPSLMAIMKASKKEIVSWSLSDLEVPLEKVGSVGSGIRVVEVFAPQAERKKLVIEGENPADVAAKLVGALMKEGVIGR